MNPLTVWLRWLFVKLLLEWKYSRKHLKIGYLVYIKGCKFGNFNSLLDNSILSNVELGNFSYVGHSAVLANVRIGKFSSIGPEVLAGLGKHPSRHFVSTHPIFYSPNCQTQISFLDNSIFEESSPITIGNDVWIGARAIILDGVDIGDGAIVGAGAVVTKNVPPYAVVGGIPARVLRYRFTDEEIEFLRDCRWWDRSEEWMKTNLREMQDIKSLMQSEKRRI